MQIPHHILRHDREYGPQARVQCSPHFRLQAPIQLTDAVLLDDILHVLPRNTARLFRFVIQVEIFYGGGVR